MKKIVGYFICFIFTFFMFSIDVSAKSYNDENISLSFGDDNVLNLNYQGYKYFSVEDRTFVYNEKEYYFTNEDKARGYIDIEGERLVYNDETNKLENQDNLEISLVDKSFYYNGNLYYFTDEDESKGYIDVEGERLTYDSINKVLTSANNHEFYGFHVDLSIKTNKVYRFYQEVCYKYDDVERCSVDKGDISDLTPDVYSHNFFYSFIPFYDQGLTFDYIYFNFKFVNISDSNDVIEIEKMGFDISKGDIINYKDSFKLEMINHGYNHTYEGKNYILPKCMDSYFDEFLNKEVYDFVDCSNSLALNLSVLNYSNDLTSNRSYQLSFDIYPSLNEKKVYTFNNDDIYVIKTGIYGGIFRYYYLEKFNGNLSLDNAISLYIPLDGIIKFNKAEFVLSDINFKLDLKYTCISGNGSDCNDLRANNGMVVNSYIYYFDLDNPIMDNQIITGTKLPNFSKIVGSEEVTISVDMKDLNGIDSIEYFISNNGAESDLNQKTYTSIENGQTITINQVGKTYIYFRVKEKGQVEYFYTYNPQEIIIDNTPPSMTGNNFTAYNTNDSYSSVNLVVRYSDDNLDITNQIKSKAYYKIIKENEKNSVSVDDIVNANLYSDGVVIDNSIVSEDDKYLACFVFVDYIGNKSDKICSPSYNIDVTALTKEEVSVTSSSEYVNTVNTTISIDKVSDGVHFKCGLSKVEVNSQNELGNTCYNNKETSLKVNDEAIYHLWIYASDSAGNYNLIKLDNEFYIDSMAPRVATSIEEGDNTIYSNNVKIGVSAFDLNQTGIELQYQFYLSSYYDKDFLTLELGEDIAYPYDYYGSYKLAIKACDSIGNCKVYTTATTYLIDTAQIVLSLIGDKTISILQYQKYIELGAYASKGNAGKHKVEVDYSISGVVDNKKTGVYVLTYTAGEGMNQVVVTREIEVKSSKYYIIGLVSLFIVGEAIILARLFIKKRKNDNI